MTKPAYQIDDKQFAAIVKDSRNICQALKKMGLSPIGAGYRTFRKRCSNLGLDTTHFRPECEIRKTVTDADVADAVANTVSLSACLKHLQLHPGTRHNRNWLTAKILRCSVDSSHWLGQAACRGIPKGPSPRRKTIDELLQKGSSLNDKQKLRLIQANVLIEKCYECSITHWQNRKLSLHLDHINGDHYDNRLENLRLLCPNCHSLTPTYCRRKTTNESQLANTCVDCDSVIVRDSIRCRSCAASAVNKPKIFWPSKETLLKRLLTTPYTALAKELGVSDNAIRKRIKNH